MILPIYIYFPLRNLLYYKFFYVMYTIKMLWQIVSFSKDKLKGQFLCAIGGVVETMYEILKPHVPISFFNQYAYVFIESSMTPFYCANCLVVVCRRGYISSLCSNSYLYVWKNIFYYVHAMSLLFVFHHC